MISAENERTSSECITCVFFSLSINLTRLSGLLMYCRHVPWHKACAASLSQSFCFLWQKSSKAKSVCCLCLCVSISVSISVSRSPSFCFFQLQFNYSSTIVEPRSNGPAINGILPITDANSLFLQVIFCYFLCYFLNRRPHIIEENC